MYLYAPMRWYLYQLAERAMGQKTKNRRLFVETWLKAELCYMQYGEEKLVGFHATWDPDGKSDATDRMWVLANVFRMKRQGLTKSETLDFKDLNVKE